MELKSSKRFTNPFNPLNLKPEAASELKTLAEVRVREYPHVRALFARREHRPQPMEVHVRKRRRQVVRAAPAGSEVFHRPRSLSSTSDLPIVPVTGTIEGDLDDTIYGLVGPILDMMRIKTSYRASVLASLIKPTAEDPFRSVSIKWIEKGQPFHVRAVIKNHDFVYMEAIGTRYLRNGELVGYQLVHSVQFPETTSRKIEMRGNMSMSAVYRQRDDNVVDVFLKGFLNPAGGLTRALHHYQLLSCKSAAVRVQECVLRGDEEVGMEYPTPMSNGGA